MHQNTKYTNMYKDIPCYKLFASIPGSKYLPSDMSPLNPAMADLQTDFDAFQISQISHSQPWHYINQMWDNFKILDKV